MAQNVYDNPDFLDGYRKLGRQQHGLDGAAEWPDLQTMLPSLPGRAVVDLGCGFGWFSDWAASRGAASVLAVDLSELMLSEARARNESEAVTYERADLDELELDSHSFDLVHSSLALHYVLDLPRLILQMAGSLRSGGRLVFSVEHPIYSAPASQQFERSESGRQVWPLEGYLVEGNRSTTWYVERVEKQHRTVATYVNQVIDAGLRIDRLVEWGPTTAQVEANPELQRDLDRPWFLLVQATKP